MSSDPLAAPRTVASGARVPALRVVRLGSLVPCFFIAPSVALLLLFVAYPAFYALNLSTFSYTFGKESEINYVGLLNYTTLFNDGRFWASMSQTAVFTTLAVSVSVLLGLGLAILFSGTPIFGERLLTSLLLLPVMLTPIVVGLTWKWLFDPLFGVINFALRSVGLPDPVWLGDPRLAMTSIVIVDVWQFTPFVFLTLLAGLKALPGEVYEAARVDGASAVQSFWNITLPLLRPILVIVVLLRTFMTVRTFDTIFILTRGGPASSTEVINLHTYRVGFEFLHMGEASALSVVIFVLCVVLSIVFLRAIPLADG